MSVGGAGLALAGPAELSQQNLPDNEEKQKPGGEKTSNQSNDGETENYYGKILPIKVSYVFLRSLRPQETKVIPKHAEGDYFTMKFLSSGFELLENDTKFTSAEGA